MDNGQMRVENSYSAMAKLHWALNIDFRRNIRGAETLASKCNNDKSSSLI